MKKKFALFNFVIAFAVLFAILFQSLHSYEHFLSNDVVLEQENTHDSHLHQNDHNHQKCFVCEFIFNSDLASQKYSFTLIAEFAEVPYQLFVSATPSFFSGSSFSLRGPPAFIA